MITYNPRFLDKTTFLSDYETEILNNMSKNLKFKELLKNNKEQSALQKLYFDFIYTSAKIEGNSYTRGEAQTLFETKKPIGSKNINEAIMLLNIKEALEYVLEKQPEINKHSIREIHQILSQNLLTKEAQGGVRKIAVYISNSDYMPLDNPHELENQMDKMLDIYHTIKNPYDKAIYIHNNLAYLQYFQDCNKRLARLIQNLSLLNSNLAFLSYNAARAEGEIIAKYKEGLIAYYESGNTTLYTDFFVSEYEKTLEFLNIVKQKSAFVLVTS